MGKNYLCLDTGGTSVKFSVCDENGQILSRGKMPVGKTLEDFLNLHNGLFTVNMSNNYSVELQLAPPQIMDEALVDLSPDAVSYLFPVLYQFGTIYFLLSFFLFQPTRGSKERDNYMGCFCQ